MGKWITILQNRPWFILLLPVFLVLHIEKNYTGLISYGLVWKPILYLIFAAIAVYFLLIVLIRDKSKAGAIAFIVLLVYYFFADVKDWLHEQSPTAWYSRYVFVVPTMVLITTFTVLWMTRHSRKLTRFFLFANLLLLISVLTDLASISFKKLANSNPSARLEIKPCPNCKLPDVFYIIFDSYSSSDLLRNEFGFDNGDLDRFLSQKGFFIARQSTSNYNFTAYSLASIFNLNYVSVPDSLHLVTLRGLLPGVEKVRMATLFPAMEKLGYKIYNHSIFDINGLPSSTRQFDIWELSDLYNRHQLPWKLLKDIGWNFGFLSAFDIDRKHAEAYIRNRDLNFESTVEEIGKTLHSNDTQPKFVYAHSLIPHAPFSYDSTGRHLPFKEYSANEDKAAYIQQLVFANKVIKRIVDEILRQNGRECIIMLQGDHAFRFFNPAKKQEEFENLNAWYFPNRDYHLLNDSLSSVNSFRLLLNAQFGQDLPILKDSSIFLPYRLSF